MMSNTAPHPSIIPMELQEKTPMWATSSPPRQVADKDYFYLTGHMDAKMNGEKAFYKEYGMWSIKLYWI